MIENKIKRWQYHETYLLPVCVVVLLVAFTNIMKLYLCYETVHWSYVITKLDVSWLINRWTYIVQIFFKDIELLFCCCEKQTSIQIHKQHKYNVNILHKTKTQQITTSGTKIPQQNLKWDHVWKVKNINNNCWSKAMYWRTILLQQKLKQGHVWP